MIKLDKVNKYFNRHKKNEIHVINNISLDLPKNGLVALLGPSGSGKTTILNAIGGLDKVNNGKIFIDNNKITQRSVSKVDKIRNLNVGYIFQDYKLVEGSSVYDNVSLSLKLIGIKDKEEISKRVLYTLEKVGMARYKNRPVGMLSGGERQRVGIARALAKNPKIILADEPTGNLDSKNSIDIMNIIKSISKEYLVILVTHEEDLARFYADYIIELEDGMIKNEYKNSSERSLNYEIENRFYLKDFKNYEKISNKNLNLEIYNDEKSDKLNAKIIFKNGNIYIKTENEEKIEVIDNNSNIELINDHYKEIKKLDIKDNTFEFQKFDNNHKLKYSSIFKFGEFIKYGFKKIIDYSFLKKMLLLGFAVSGMFIFYSISSIFGILNIKDKDFINSNKEYLTLVDKKIKVDDYLAFENDLNIDYILPGDGIIKFKFKYDKYLQTQNYAETMSGSLSDINMITKDDLLIGNMPENEYEVVIDKLTIDRFIKNYTTKLAGFISYKDFLNHNLYLNNVGAFKIVGITDLEEPNVYASKDLFINMLSNSYKGDEYFSDFEESKSIVDYNLVIDKEITLKKGRLPLNDYEVIVPIDKQYEMPLNRKISTKVNNKKLKVVGYYQNNSFVYHTEYMTNFNTSKYYLITNSKNLTIKPINKNEVIDTYRNQKINIYDSYDHDRNTYLSSVKDSIIKTVIISGIILGISLLEMLLMMRSSFLSRIKEVGIYRAIGVKRTDIYKMFTGEIIAITTLASIPGVAFMCYILYNLIKIPYISTLYLVTPLVFIISVLVVIIFNLTVGLIPVYNTIRKTPAQILSRLDVD